MGETAKNLRKLKNSGKKNKDAKAAVVKKTRRKVLVAKKAAKLAASGGGQVVLIMTKRRSCWKAKNIKFAFDFQTQVMFPHLLLKLWMWNLIIQSPTLFQT